MLRMIMLSVMLSSTLIACGNEEDGGDGPALDEGDCNKVVEVYGCIPGMGCAVRLDDDRDAVSYDDDVKKGDDVCSACEVTDDNC